MMQRLTKPSGRRLVDGEVDNEYAVKCVSIQGAFADQRRRFSVWRPRPFDDGEHNAFEDVWSRRRIPAGVTRRRNLL